LARSGGSVRRIPHWFKVANVGADHQGKISKAGSQLSNFAGKFWDSRIQLGDPENHQRGLFVWAGWAKDDSRIILQEWIDALSELCKTDGLAFCDSKELDYSEKQ